MTKFAIPILWALAMLATRIADPLTVVLVVASTMAAIVFWRERTTMIASFRVTPRVVVLGLAAAALMIGVTYLAVPFLLRSVPEFGTETLAVYTRFLSDRSVATILAGVIPVVFAEEVLWRGEFQRSLGHRNVLVTALIYALAHAPAGSLLLVVVAFVCGLYWSALRAVSGSLIPALCAHLAWDIALIVVPLVR